MKRVIIFVIAIFFSLTALSATGPAKSVKKRISSRTLKKIMVLIEKKNFKSATVLFNKALKAVPDDARLNAVGGYLFYKAGDFQKAQKYLLKAISLNPSDYSSLNLLGVVYALKGEPDRAFLYLSRAARGAGNNPYYFYNLGLVFYEIGNYEEAEKALEKAISIKPDFIHAYFLRGLAAIEQKNFEKAEEIFKILTRAGNNAFMGIAGLAVLAQEKGNYDEALRLFQQALQYKPDDLYITLSIANLYFLKGDYAAARDIYRKVYKSASRFRKTDVIFSSGVMFAASSANAGIYEDYFRMASYGFWKKVKRKHLLFDPVALLANAVFYRTKGLYKIAEDVLKEALKNPGDVEDLIYFELGKTLFERAYRGLTPKRIRDFREAAKYFQKSYVLNSEMEEIPFYMALSKYYSGTLDKKHGQKDLFQAISIFKNLKSSARYATDAMKYLVMATYQVGDCAAVKKGFEEFSQKAQHIPPEILLIVGDCYLQDRELNNAVVLFQEYLKLVPEDEDMKKVIAALKEDIKKKEEEKKKKERKKKKSGKG